MNASISQKVSTDYLCPICGIGLLEDANGFTEPHVTTECLTHVLRDIRDALLSIAEVLKVKP